MSIGSTQVYVIDVRGIQSYLILDNGDRDGSQTIGFFQPFDMADHLRGFYCV
jgi:hypothetical protein